jgi:hypothetical protein
LVNEIVELLLRKDKVHLLLLLLLVLVCQLHLAESAALLCWYFGATDELVNGVADFHVLRD